MRTLFIVCIILTVALLGADADILSMNFELQTGYFLIDQIVVGSPHLFTVVDQQKDFLATNMMAELLMFDTLFVGGRMRCDFMLDEFTGNPFLQRYWFFAGIRFGGVEIGITHLCIHPVEISGQTNTNIISGGNTELYVKFSGNIKLF